jgi:hypothetical protein
MSKNLNSELKKEESYTYDPSNRGIERSSGALGHGLYKERHIMLIIYHQIELDKLNLYETLMCSIPKMCWWLCMRFYIISSRCMSLFFAALWTA